MWGKKCCLADHSPGHVLTQRDDHLHSTGIHHMYLKPKHSLQDWNFQPLLRLLLPPSSSSSVSCADTIQRLWAVRAVGLFILHREEGWGGPSQAGHMLPRPGTGCSLSPQQERSGAHRNDRHMTDLSARAARVLTHTS